MKSNKGKSYTIKEKKEIQKVGNNISNKARFGIPEGTIGDQLANKEKVFGFVREDSKIWLNSKKYRLGKN